MLIVDFILGGLVVAGSLLVASSFGPLWGGLVLALPSKTVATLFLSPDKSEFFVSNLITGLLLSLPGTAVFCFAMLYLIKKFDLLTSFILALFAALLVILIIFR